MITTYTYQNKTYDTLHEVSKALAKNCIFIPLSISDDNLQELGVTVMREEEPIENVKQRKILILKRQRDAAEVEPIEYNGHSFDYDDKARDRINAAVIALSLQGEGASIDWTTADNQDVKVTADDLRAIVAAVAVRSNTLHTAYREAKAQVGRCATAADLEAIKVEH